MTITPMSKITFGQRGCYGSYGKRVRDLGDKFLQWIVANADKDPMAAFAPAAREVLAQRANDAATVGSLEARADEILRKAGYRKLVPKGRR